jgi:hypothetical protein
MLPRLGHQLRQGGLELNCRTSTWGCGQKLFLLCYQKEWWAVSITHRSAANSCNTLLSWHTLKLPAWRTSFCFSYAKQISCKNSASNTSGRLWLLSKKMPVPMGCWRKWMDTYVRVVCEGIARHSSQNTHMVCKLMQPVSLSSETGMYFGQKNLDGLRDVSCSKGA